MRFVTRWMQRIIRLTLEEEGVVIDALIGWHFNACRLNQFQRRFIADNERRYEENGANTFFSPKQWKIVLEIRDKVCPIPLT